MNEILTDKDGGMKIWMEVIKRSAFLAHELHFLDAHDEVLVVLHVREDFSDQLFLLLLSG